MGWTVLTQTTRDDGSVIVKIDSRRLDSECADSVRASIGKLLDENPPVMIIDIGSVEFMDSTGLGVLISTLRRLPARSALRICCAQPSVTSFLRLTGMDRILALFPTEHEALNSGIGRVV
jgi:anti-sigma B factor antagonist